MPTKILVVESPTFQLGANAGESTERVDPAAFPARLQKHIEEKTDDILFVLAHTDLRFQGAFADATNGNSSVSIAYFASTNDAIRFLPSLLLFAGNERGQGVKDYLQKGSTIYSESFFNSKAIGGKLDPCFVFARNRLTSAAATNAWGCLQSLVFLGLQSLPEQGEKGTGEKVDVQIGADDKYVAFTVRFDVAPEKIAFLRANPMLTLSRFSAGVMEVRYLEAAKKVELTCLFARGIPTEKPIEIISHHRTAALENGAEVKGLTFKTFGSLLESGAEEKRVVSGGGFKKKFSERVKLVSSQPEEETVTKIKAGAEASTREVVVSGKASLSPEKETVFKNENAANRVIELEAQVRGLEATLKARDEALGKASKDLNDPLKKRDVITNIKDSQSEGLKQTVKALETELEECSKREKELMKMVDKAVQMKDDAAKKIKELDLKLKQASGGQGSKVQMLEKAIEEQKRQNKELSARVSELNAKLKAAA